MPVPYAGDASALCTGKSACATTPPPAPHGAAAGASRHRMQAWRHRGRKAELVLCALPASPVNRQATGSSVKFTTATRPPSGINGNPRGRVKRRYGEIRNFAPQLFQGTSRSSGVGCSTRFCASTCVKCGKASENTTSFPPPSFQRFHILIFLEVERRRRGQSRVAVEPVRERLADEGGASGCQQAHKFGHKLRISQRLRREDCGAGAFGKMRGRGLGNSQHADLIENVCFFAGIAGDGLVGRQCHSSRRQRWRAFHIGHAAPPSASAWAWYSGEVSAP